MGQTQERIFDLTLTGHFGLDLVNTIDWRTSDQPTELLGTYADLVRWSRHTGLVTEREERELLREARRRPAEAEAVLARAVALREALYGIFSACAAETPARPADLECLNGELSGALSRLRIARASGGYAWYWRAGTGSLDSMLWPTARAAGELLVSPELHLLRECGGEGCGWLFLDTSRNKSRRWCMMGICGNRAKAKRFYEQARAKR